jgi:hypothetical protein
MNSKVKRMSRYTHTCLLFILCLVSAGRAQQRSIPLEEMAGVQLDPSSVSETALAPVGGIVGQIRCSSAGDLYLKPEFSPLLRLTEKGQTPTYFDVNSIPKAELLSGAGPLMLDFATDSSGSVFILGIDARRPFVFLFNANGQYRTKTSIDAVSAFKPARISVFPDGNYLLIGDIFLDESGRDRRQVAEIFSGTGQKIAAVNLRETKSGTHIQTGAQALPFPINSVLISESGNAYIMRSSNAPLIYVVSPAGRLLKRLRVQSPNGFVATDMKLGNSKFLIGYQKGSGANYKTLFVEYDNIDGHIIAKFESGPKINGALTCYSENELVFLGVRAGRRVLIHAKTN